MLRKIRLYGQLAKFVGHRVLEADVASAAEAVRFMLANWPELEQHMAAQHYRVSIGSYDLTLDELHDPAGQQEISIVPVVAGGAGDGATNILIGIALIATAFITMGASLSFSASGFSASAAAAYATGGWATVAAIAGNIGIALVLGGVAQLLSPVPKIPQGPDTQGDPRKVSFNFSGLQNSSRAGVPVPIVYGKTLTGSVVISAGIDTVRVPVRSNGSTAPTSGPGGFKQG